jgi:putative transposase
MAFWKLYYHIVWGTKNGRPFIIPVVEQHLYPNLVQRAAEMGAFVFAINGWLNHVHLVVSIPPKLAIALFVKDLKGASSHFINDRCWLDEQFNWQRGYGVLSMGETQRPFAEAYVLNQKQHHEQQTTNSWLERTADEDEGLTVPAQGMLREPGVVYQVGDELPF